MSYERKRRKAIDKRKSLKKRKRGKSRTEQIFNLIPLVVVVAITGFVLMNRFGGSETGPPAPYFSLNDVLTDRVFDLHAQGKEQLIVLDFFQINCPNCMTNYNTALKPLRDYFGADIVIISISKADSKDNMLKYIDENQVRWFVGLDKGGQMFTDYEITTVPTTIIVDRDARIRFRYEGTVGYETLRTHLAQLLKEQPRVRPTGLMLNVMPRRAVDRCIKTLLF